MTEATLNMHDLLCCPFHNESVLEWGEDYLVCRNCGKNYELLKYGSIVVPNFLIEDKNWIRGKRDVNSQFIKLIQGDILIDRIQKNKIVLDIGCGDNPRGNVNVDCYIPDKIPTNFILANAEYLPFRFNSVNTILSYYNIEHLLNPPDFLLTISRIAKENIIILTDNSEWIGDIFFRLFGKGRIFHDEHY
jgi:hypothetical protein